jgi:hypothetical protein
VTFHILVLTLLIVRGIKLRRVISDPAIIDIIEDDGIIKLLLLLGTLSIFVQRVLAYPKYR